MNLKQPALIFLGGMLCLNASAVPAKPGLRTFTQPDGTTVTVRLVGDESFHTQITADGIAVQRQADGFFYYRDAEGVTSVKAHDVEQRDAVEKAFLAARSADMSVKALANASEGARKARRAFSSPRKASQVPNTGSPRVPVLLVQYSDYKFKDADPKATFNKFFREGDTSAYQYFVDQSNGKYTPQFDIYGPVTLSGKRATYGGNDLWGNDIGVGKMVGQACQGLDSSIDFSLYDNDGDGECDVVIVLYAGDGEASSYDDDAKNSVWPCQWELSSSDFGRVLNLDGIKVDKFAVFNELYGANLSKIDGIGTFCHEFSHCLGLPDFYDTKYNGHYGMGYWSLMDSGSYNNDGFTPIGYSAYEKEFMGWISIEEGKENTLYSLPVLNQKNVSTDKAVRLTNAADKNEYYIVENRARQGWDAYIPTDGLLIYHATYSAAAWNGNYVNDSDMQRMTPVPADNYLKLNSINYDGEIYYVIDEKDALGDLWPYGSATELTDTSVPAAKVNTGSYLGKPLTEMTRNADGTISFWCMKAALPSVDSPVLDDHIVPDETSFTATWQASASAGVTYTLEVSEHRDIIYSLVMDVDFSSDNHGWESTGYTAVENGATRFGSNKNNGALDSPVFTTDDSGIVTVQFNAKSYDKDASSVNVCLLDATGYEITSKTVALGSSYGDYTVVLSGKASAGTKVSFETLEKKKRFYLKSAKVYTGDASDAAKASSRATESGDDTRRVITGITGTSYTVTGLKAGGVYDYRVKAVPVDDANFVASAWSETKTVNLAEPAGIGTIVAGDSNAPVEYYNLQGVRVDNPSSGIYIRRQGSRVEKVYVK